MKEYIYSKIISGIIIISLSLGTALLPISTVYAATTGGSGYSGGGGAGGGNGFAGGNPYAFNYSNIFSSGIIGSVIGCTGVANTISKAISGLLNPAKLGADVVDLADSVAGQAGGAPGPSGKYVVVMDKKAYDAQVKAGKTQDAAEMRSACLNGIAYQLAKRQLADITAKTIGWINGGYMGDPMYILNSQSYFQTVANQEIRTVTSIYADPKNNFLYPYGLAFAQGAVLEARNKAQYLGVSTLNAFFANGRRRLADGSTPQTRNFAYDFSLGGWAGWNMLTQEPYNNPLGFTMQTAQRLADKIEGNNNDTQNEINRNGGFLDQKVCAEWDGIPTTSSPQAGGTDYISLPPGSNSGGPINANVYPKKAITPTTSPKGFELINTAYADNTTSSATSTPITNKGIEQNTSTTDKTNTNGVGTCIKYKTITPGSVIENQANQLTSSQIRQLELANDINSSLDQIFVAALNEITNEGLTGLAKAFAPKQENNPNNQGGLGTNRIFDSSGNDITNAYQNSTNLFSVNRGNGWSNNGNDFDITTALRPHYVYDSLGNIVHRPVVYAVVNGVTMDGSKAANSDPVTKKAVYAKDSDGVAQDGSLFVQDGAIQVQQKYIDVVNNESLPRTWEIASTVGALDYCIPGPNPLWEPGTHNTITASISFLQDSYFEPGPPSRIVTPDPSTLKDSYVGSDPGSQINGYNVASNVLYAVAAVCVAIPGPGWIIAGIAAAAGFVVQMFGSGEEEAATQKERDKIQNDGETFARSQSDGIEILQTTFSNYYDKVNAIYGPNGPMVTLTAGQENQYLPMAQAGEQMTKNITNYYLTVKQADLDYAAAVDQTKSNIYKLQQIKAKVDKIVNDAKHRQCDETKGMKWNDPTGKNGTCHIGNGTALCAMPIEPNIPVGPNGTTHNGLPLPYNPIGGGVTNIDGIGVGDMSVTGGGTLAN